MTQQTINLGTVPNDGTGDPIRTGGTKLNSNFTELYSYRVWNTPNTITAATYTIDSAPPDSKLDSVIIANRAGTVTLTFPASPTTGRVIRIKTYQSQTVVSASSNVIPITGGAAGTAILAATAGKWADVQYNGTNWEILAAN